MALQDFLFSVGLLSLSLYNTATTAPLDQTDCSYADIDDINYGGFYAPLPKCVAVESGSSIEVYCDKDGNVKMDKYDSSALCQGTPDTTDIQLSSLKSWQCSTECSLAVASMASALLPDPVDIQTPSPTLTPTASTTAKPTPSPITSITQSQTLSESSTITLSATQTTTLMIETTTDDDDSFISDSQPAIKPFATPSIPIHAVCLLITFGLFCGSIYHLLIKKRNPTKKTIKWTVKLFVLLTFISNIVGITCITIVSIIISSTAWTQQEYNMALIPYYGISVAYCCGKFNLECFFLFRVYSAFRNSTYALSKQLCVALICWMFAVSLAWCYMFVGDLNHDHVPYYLYILVSVLEMLLIIVLLHLFLKRLAKLILRHKLNPKVTNNPSESRGDSKVSVNISSIMPDSTTLSNHSSSVNTDARTSVTPTAKSSIFGPTTPRTSNTSSSASQVSTVSSVKSFQSSLSTKQTKWIFLITRCILLSGISLITTMLFGFFAFYGSQFRVHIFVVYALWSIDMATNSVCLYLNFVFSNSLYNRGCSLCHGFCQQMVEQIAAKQMLKRYLDDIKNLQNTPQQSEKI